MSALAVSPPIRVILEVALLVLPRHSRDRYRHEFAAELQFIPRRNRLGYVLRLLICTLPLRAALTSSQPEQVAGLAITAKPLRCRLRLHTWTLKHNEEDGGRYHECRRCGAQRDEPTTHRAGGMAGLYSGPSGS